MKFVDIKNDVAFRKIFGNENRKEVLISFLNAVLCLQENKKIIEVTILTPYQLPELRGGKVTIVDVKAKDQTGKTYIVEMQVGDDDGFHKRVLYYASKSYSSQISRGDEFEKLMPTFLIGILDFVATKNTNYLSRHIVKDAETGEHFIEDIEFNFIELPKFNKKPEELESIIDQWVYFIKNAENLNLIPDSIDDQGLIYAYHGADMHNWSVEELEAYDKVFMREQVDKNRWEKATRKAIENATEKGVQKGKQEMVFNLFKFNHSDEDIAKIANITMEEVRDLRTKI
jgi:predicted transposase/invertase (TIGR01784 family)